VRCVGRWEWDLSFGNPKEEDTEPIADAGWDAGRFRAQVLSSRNICGFFLPFVYGS
jgi:hypothetical protein